MGKLVKKLRLSEEIGSLSIYQMNLIFNSQIEVYKNRFREKPGQNLGWMYYQLRDSYKNKWKREKEGGKWKLQFTCACVCSVVSDSLQTCGLWPARFLSPWDSLGKNTGLPFPPPGDLPDSGTEPMSPASSALQADSLPLSLEGSPALFT